MNCTERLSGKIVRLASSKLIDFSIPNSRSYVLRVQLSCLWILTLHIDVHLLLRFDAFLVIWDTFTEYNYNNSEIQRF
jgi:hypothetical protein